MPPKRVLMLAHDFPPAGGSGSNRALAFARYLPESGWEPTVVTPGAAWAANRDERLLDELPPGLRVIRTRSFEPRPASGGHTQGVGGVRRAPGALRANLGHLKRFPDAHIGWLPFALAASRRVEYDVAYSSSGPFTSHLVGLLLKRLSKRPWVVELRDGWYRWNRAIFPDYPRWRDPLERRLEAAALKNADRVILVTDRMATAFRCQYERSLPGSHFGVVSNGFDRVQFPDSPPVAKEGDGFEVLHAGALYYGRSLSAVLEAARQLVQSVPSFAQKFRLTLLGTLDPLARGEIDRSGLAEHIRYRGQLDHVSTIQAMRAADLLLLVANTTPGAEATVPGKLFEYLAIGRPVLAIAPRDSSTADVLTQSGIGGLAPSGDPTAIARVLLQAFQAHEAGILLRQASRLHEATGAQQAFLTPEAVDAQLARTDTEAAALQQAFLTPEAVDAQLARADTEAAALRQAFLTPEAVDAQLARADTEAAALRQAFLTPEAVDAQLARADTEAAALRQAFLTPEAVDAQLARVGSEAAALQQASLSREDAALRVHEPGDVARFDRRLLTRDLAAIFDQAWAGARGD